MTANTDNHNKKCNNSRNHRDVTYDIMIGLDIYEINMTSKGYKYKRGD